MNTLDCILARGIMIFIHFLAALLADSLLPNFILGYDESLGMNLSCRYRCDLHRSGGWSGEYEFDCNTVLDKDEEKDYCMQDCWKCPETVCNSSIPNIFKCPRTDIEDDCKRRCDLHRPSHILDGYILDCEETEHDEISGCKQDCAKCPNWVCNEDEDQNIYHCPTTSIDEECKTICDDMRNRKYKEEFSDIFFAVCSEYYTNDISKCNETCGKCPTNVCNPRMNDADWFYCPRLAEPKLLSTTLRTTSTASQKYGGRCKERCDKFRLGGGTGEYELDCSKIFTTEGEIKKCREDCEQCPEEYCQPEDYKGGPYFHCPAVGDHGADQARIANLTSGLIAMSVITVILAIMLVVVVTLGYFKFRGIPRRVTPGPREALPRQDNDIDRMFAKNDTSQSPPSPVLESFDTYLDDTPIAQNKNSAEIYEDDVENLF